MKTYYVDFKGYCEIKANDGREAIEKFKTIINDEPENVYEIVYVGEKQDD